MNDKSQMSMRLGYLAIALALFGCGPETSTKEEMEGVLEKFEDTPGVVRTEIVDAAGRLTAIGYYRDGKKEGV